MVKIQHHCRIRKSLALQKMLFAKLCALSVLVLLQACLGTNLFSCNNVCVLNRLFSQESASAVNEFACGRAPAYLKRYVAGGVSIALETKTSVRPLALDPIRRLVA